MQTILGWGSRISTLETKVAALTDQLNTIKNTTLPAITTGITTLQADATAIIGTVTTLQGQLASGVTPDELNTLQTTLEGFANSLGDIHTQLSNSIVTKGA